MAVARHLLVSDRTWENRRFRARETQLESLEPKVVLAASVVPAYTVTQDWGSGFEGRIQLTNQQSTAVSNWTLEFHYGATITSIWDGRIVSHTGTHYVVANVGWNSTLAAGGQVAFGFIASPGTTPAAPANYILNGKPLSGDTTPPPSLPSITIADVSIAEGNSGEKNVTFTIDLSAKSTKNVTVKYATRDGSAAAGSDYKAKSGTLTFSAGQTRKTVTVAVAGDALFESNEDFFLDLSAVTSATLARTSAKATITNDDAAPPPPPPPSNPGNPDSMSSDVKFAVTNDWGNGFNGDVSVRYTGTGTVRNWSLSFTFNGQISSIWNGTIVSRVGNTYVVQGASWNKDVAAGQTITFGFTGSPGGAAAVLTNFALSGQVDNSTGGGSSGGSSGGGGTTTPPASNARLATSTVAWSNQYYAPYVDSTLWPTYDFVSVARNQGIKFFTLAFVVADTANQPAWGGFSVYGVGSGEFDASMKANIGALRALGGDVMVSFGGAANRELAEVITDVGALTAAYQTVIDNYGLTHIDFDIEGHAAADRASIDRRNQAIARLQQNAAAAGRPLEVAYTLPVLPTGLTNDGLYIIQSAIAHGVKLAGVNIMTMDYGDSAAPNPQGRMGDYAIQAATSLHAQLKTTYNGTLTDAQLWKMVGVTPMIGVNDVLSEVFDQQEARELLAFAEQKSIGRISIWSLNRDYQNPAGTLNQVDLKSSSILQSPLEFSLLFNQVSS